MMRWLDDTKQLTIYNCQGRQKKRLYFNGIRRSSLNGRDLPQQDIIDVYIMTLHDYKILIDVYFHLKISKYLN